MLRSLFAMLTIALVGISQGCRICDSPYDYCGPVMPCGEGCGAGGCGHRGYEGGYAGGDGDCATCGNGGGHAVEYSNEYESAPMMQGQPTLVPDALPSQTRRPTTKSVIKPTTKASYEAPLRSVKAQPASQQGKPAKMSPYPTQKNPGPRIANSGNGPIYR